MKQKIGEALRKAEIKANRIAQAETLMKNVQWKRQDSNETEYAPETNLEIDITKESLAVVSILLLTL